LVSIRTDQPSYRPGARVAVTVQLQDEARNPVPQAAVDAVAISTDGQRYSIRLQPDATIPGRYTGTWDELPSGIYRVEPAGPEVERLLSGAPVPSREAAATSFVVREPWNPEQLDTRSDPVLAQQIAEIT